jgi:hypothetical protein
VLGKILGLEFLFILIRNLRYKIHNRVFSTNNLWNFCLHDGNLERLFCSQKDGIRAFWNTLIFENIDKYLPVIKTGKGNFYRNSFLS